MSLKEEVECITTITRSLKHALHVFTSLPNATSHLQSAHQTSVDEAVEFLEVMHNVLSSDPNPQRLRCLIFDMNAELISLLFQYIGASLVTAPGNPTGALAQFQRFRCVVLQILTKVMALCSNDHLSSDDVGNDPEGARVLSRLIGDATIRCNGLDAVLHVVLHPSTPDDLKLPAVECLFVMLMRNMTIQYNFIQRNGVIGSMLDTLSNEPSPTIRNYLCACLRELSNSYSAKLVQEGCPQVLIHLSSVDLSPDVRALCAETFDVIVKSDPNFWLRFDAKAELATHFVQRLDRESNAEVVETLGKLLETCFTKDAMTFPRGGGIEAAISFTEHFISQRGERALVQGLKHAPRAASMVARALRFLIQYAPFYREIGRALFSHFPSVSLILKICIDHATDLSKNTLAHQVLRVELSIAIALCFAQSPANRDILHRELTGYPGWMSSLRDAVLKHLNNASLEYYVGIPMVDCTGTLLNAVNVEGLWEDGDRPNKMAVKNLFVSQEKRVQTQSGLPAPSEIPQGSSEQRAIKLTFILLSYATHLALSGNTAAQQSAATVGMADLNSTAQPAVAYTQPPPAPIPVEMSPLHQHVSIPHSHASLPPPQHAEVYATPSSHYQPSAMYPPHDVPGGRPPVRSGMVPAPSHFAPSPPRDPTHALPSSMHYDPNVYVQPDPTYYGPPDAPANRMSPAPTRTSILREIRSNPYKTQAMRSMSNGPPPQMRNEPTIQTARNTARSPATTRVQDPAIMELFSKFDAAFSLCVKFGLYYKKKDAPKPPVYATTPDGFVVRQSRSPYPWVPVVQKQRLKSWSVKDVKEGDLFFFSIPFTELSIPVIGKVIERAQRHMRAIKRLFITTPQNAKGRRWFLYDSLNHILPRIVQTLQELHQMVLTHGEDNIKFPVFMFREKELHVGQRAVHCGNVLEIMEQIRYYFAQQPPEVGRASSQYLKDIEEKIRALSQQQYTGTEADDLSDDSDEDILLRDPHSGTMGGHGGLDSDCDTVSSEGE